MNNKYFWESMAVMAFVFAESLALIDAASVSGAIFAVMAGWYAGHLIGVICWRERIEAEREKLLEVLQKVSIAQAVLISEMYANLHEDEIEVQK